MPATVKVLVSYMWLMATVLDSKSVDHLYHHRAFCWAALFYNDPSGCSMGNGL